MLKTAPRKRTYHRFTRHIVLVCYAAMWLTTAINPQLSHAIESDRSAPIEIQADSAKISEAQQTAIYKGNVELVQGTLRIICDQLTVFNSPTGVKRVEAQGKPASYTQQMDAEKPPLDAAAGKIIYLPPTARIRLEGGATIKQGGNIFEGQLIEYDLERQVLMASGDNTDNPQGGQQQRVKMTLQPQHAPATAPPPTTP